jgi:uncharacterized membrane protein
MKILSFILVALLMVSTVFAQSQELNFTRESNEDNTNISGRENTQANFRVTSLRQEPFPANPGEYVDLYFKITNIGGDVENPMFEIIPKYPLSVYPENDGQKEFSVLSAGEQINLKYRLKIDQNALAGNYEVEFRAKILGNEVYYPYFFNVDVEDVTTTFDVALQEITKDGASIAISNTGSNPANSITVILDDQKDFNLFGSSSYIIGNLNNGDYTVVNALVAPKEGKNEPKLQVQIDYTDITGNRRTVYKEIPVVMNLKVEKGFEELTGYVVAGDLTKQNNSPGFSALFSLALILGIVGTVIYYRRKIKKIKDEE